MIKGAVLYNGVWLAPNSKAYELFQAKKMDELKKHMKVVSEKSK